MTPTSGLSQWRDLPGPEHQGGRTCPDLSTRVAGPARTLLRAHRSAGPRRSLSFTGTCARVSARPYATTCADFSINTGNLAASARTRSAHRTTRRGA
jgi:hypothetical protein